MDLGKYAKDLQGLLDLMKRNDLAELEIEGESHRIRLRKKEPQISAAPIAFSGDALALPTLAASGDAAAADAAEPPESDDTHRVTSPLVGTFYRASSPEADPFVQEGDRVEADTVLCIVEAMKVMNEIQAGVAGVVREITVGNGDPVEFGETLFRIDTG